MDSHLFKNDFIKILFLSTKIKQKKIFSVKHF